MALLRPLNVTFRRKTHKTIVVDPDDAAMRRVYLEPSVDLSGPCFLIPVARVSAAVIPCLSFCSDA